MRPLIISYVLFVNIKRKSRVVVQRQLMNILRNRKSWIDHVLRGNGLLKEVIEGRMEGKRDRGRLQLRMLDEIKVRSYVDMKRRTEDRVGWKSYVPWTSRK